jgi:hypothetical protein
VRRLRPELWLQKNWLLQHEKSSLTLPFSPGNFRPKTTRLSTPHTLHFSVSPIEEKLKDRHFDSAEVIEEGRQC